MLSAEADLKPARIKAVRGAGLPEEKNFVARAQLDEPSDQRPPQKPKSLPIRARGAGRARCCMSDTVTKSRKRAFSTIMSVHGKKGPMPRARPELSGITIEPGQRG